MAMNQGSSSSGGDEAGIEKMLQQLGINEEDLDDVVFEEEEQPPPEATRWLAIARVFTESDYSSFWFFKNMRSAWDLAQDVKTRSLESNLHTFQFQCLGDWERMKEGGPWNFRGNPVLIEEYDGFTKPSEVKLFFFDIWIQIHDLPIGYAPMIKSLASKVGQFIYSEGISNDFEGNFFRVKVKLDVRKPLKSVVTLVRGGKREFFFVKYEKLPNWCQVCGHLGHEYKDHGDGLHPPQALVFKNLRASWRRDFGGPVRGRGGPRGAGRSGRSYGRGDNRPMDFADDMEEDDSDESKKRSVTDVNEQPAISAGQGAIVPADKSTKVAEIMNQFESATPPSPVPVRDTKRKKTVEEGSSAKPKNGALAGSLEGCRQAQ
jgi:hypothetical protein